MEHVKTKGFEFCFDSEDDFCKSLDMAIDRHKLSILFILSTAHKMCPVNKEGFDINKFCFLMSKMTDICNYTEFHVVVGFLVRFGFLSMEMIVDDDGDDAAIIFLSEIKIGENACRVLKKEYPDVYNDSVEKKIANIADIFYKKINVDEIDEIDEEVRH